MTKFDWFDEAVEAIVAAAKLPTFPGDEPPVREYLVKFLNRAFTSCHNGGELGKDECPVCRAIRTETVEGVLEFTKTLAKQLQEQVEKVSLEKEKAEQGWETEKAARVVAEGNEKALHTALGKVRDEFLKSSSAEAALKDTVRAKVEEVTTLQRLNIQLAEEVRVLGEKVKTMKEFAKGVLEV